MYKRQVWDNHNTRLNICKAIRLCVSRRYQTRFHQYPPTHPPCAAAADEKYTLIHSSVFRCGTYATTPVQDLKCTRVCVCVVVLGFFMIPALTGIEHARPRGHLSTFHAPRWPSSALAPNFSPMAPPAAMWGERGVIAWPRGFRWRTREPVLQWVRENRGIPPCTAARQYVQQQYRGT